jgi:hypothetical protein
LLEAVVTGAGDGTCFAACPDPTDTRSNCFADCFYASMFSGRVQRSDLLAAWNKAFAGSCPSLPPPPLATAAATALAATPTSVATPTSTLAAISIMATLGDGLSLGIGTMKKSPHNPLFGQDTPWEPRLDNGYPNIVPPAPGVKDGAKEEPKGREASWQLWYGDCVQGCNSQIVLYANSTDGIHWEKPSLNLFDVSTVRPDLKHIGKANNIVMKGGGVGVFRDDHEQDLTRRYKALGEACYLRQGDGGDDDTNTTTSVGVGDGDGGWNCQNQAVSVDGLTWTDAKSVPWPSPQRFDCHNQVIWDATHGGRYIATTRDGFSGDDGRTIGIAASPTSDFAFDTSKPPAETFHGNADHQLYSQITWPWHNTWLGIVMVFDTVDASTFGKGKVHCRLAWSNDPTRPMDDLLSSNGGDTTAKDYATTNNNNSTASGGWQWVDAAGLTGQDFVPLGHVGSSVTSGDNAFDSHVCFAAASPVSSSAGASVTGGAQEERVYYMGGNGPHSGDRNSSFAMGTLRKDGFASVTGTGDATTVSVLCTGNTLVVTADIYGGVYGGSFQIGLAGAGVAAGVGVGASVPLTTNTTGGVMAFEKGAMIPPSLVGQNVTLELHMVHASVYTVGFTTV